MNCPTALYVACSITGLDTHVSFMHLSQMSRFKHSLLFWVFPRLQRARRSASERSKYIGSIKSEVKGPGSRALLPNPNLRCDAVRLSSFSAVDFPSGSLFSFSFVTLSSFLTLQAPLSFGLVDFGMSNQTIAVLIANTTISYFFTKAGSLSTPF